MFQNLIKKLHKNGLFAFSKEIIKNPGAIGAILPSSKSLARKIASYVPNDKQGLVLELGAGTGVITQALLDKGIAAKNIFVIERSAALVKHLQKHFPEITVIHGDAMDAALLLNHRINEVHTVVSGLPFRSLPKPLIEAIVEQLHIILKPGDLFIQFTYKNKYHPLQQISSRLRLIQTSKIWLNLPPAIVEVYQA